MNLLYITFGQQSNYHLQSVFSILSFLRDKNPPKSITVFTDYPEFYTLLGAAVTIHSIDSAQLEAWKGEHHFFWRIKLKAIETMIASHAGQDILYLDSDTFLYHPAHMLEDIFARGQSIMWEREVVPIKSTLKSHLQLGKAIAGKSFAGISVDNFAMWNAGVVGIPGKQAQEVIDLALQLTDAMCAAQVPNRFVEQFSLSIALTLKTDLVRSRPIVAHYYSNKEAWEKHIAAFMSACYLKGMGLPELLTALNDFDFTQTPMLVKPKDTRLRLEKQLIRWLPDKATHYCNEDFGVVNKF